MNEQNINIDYELIAKYLSGEANDAERKKAEAWISAGDDNVRLFNNLKKVWQQTGTISPYTPADVNVDAAWKKLHYRINEPAPSQQRNNTKNIYFYFSRAAAIIVLAIVSYLAIITLKQDVSLSTNEQTLTDTLSDGSVLTLNAKSSLALNKQFNSKLRTVKLSGEAHFNVQHIPDKPFIVQLENASVKVLGTSFYIKDYDSLQTIDIGVEEGTVMFSSPNNDTSIVLKANEHIQFNKTTQKIASKKPLNPNALYWKTNTLIFHDTRLSEVFETLEHKFDVRINVENPDILNCRLTAKFTHNNVLEIIKIINTNFNLDFIQDQKQVTISGEGCITS